ncbi:DUF309 domain-containing protein [Candidatus Gracilibacteria bacterium]|jgi:uncharacterized protein|nr:DUF309 domain-containing protein [Candidatus Gracilibacteria bacterium]NJM88132.1 DUF309 domain-containing protein [Hydrococcus sp. RU_2_2]NJP18943.1 DUF309 domain-containing protein [Hydrococcus sp. CRU_1_1]NJQ97869.1 DUF309 domain-containing protein [Hydrococcus sp. CSU_1_8]
MLPQAFWQGVEEFNRQEFYACHDTLEALWMESTEIEKNFYQGILQIAVGCYHLGNYNWRGAVILLGEGIRRLRAYLPVHQGIDVETLISESDRLLKTLQQIEPEQISQFVDRLETSSDPQLLPKIVRIDD